MHLLILNPNSTAAMTQTAADAARAVARSETRITALNPTTGPAAIQGAEDGEKALPGLFALFEHEIMGRGGYNGLIIACFDDTGLWDLRRRADIPVIGIGEAGYHAALLSGERFSVVTTLAVSVPVLEENIARYGFAARCARVRASGVPVLDLEDDRQAATAKVTEEVGRAVAEDGCDAVVLGCAGMAGLAAEMTQQFGIPVIDGISSAVGLCETMAVAVPKHEKLPTGK